MNTDSWQSNDFKDVLTGSDEGDGSPAAITNRAVSEQSYPWACPGSARQSSACAWLNY